MSGSFFDFWAKKMQNSAVLGFLMVKMPIFCGHQTSFSKQKRSVILRVQALA